MRQLTMEQIKELDKDTKVIGVDKITGKNMGMFRVYNKGLLMFEFVKEDKFESLLNGDNPILIEGVDVFTYRITKLNRYQLHSVVEQDKVKFFEKLVSVLKENIHLVHPELRDSIETVSKEVTEKFFDAIKKIKMNDEKCCLCCTLSGAVNELKIEYYLDTKEVILYFEKEQEMSFHEAMTYLTNKDAKFRVESVIMDDLIPKAIDYEDECSMSDEDKDSQEDFLNEFIQKDYNSMKDILKFITFYGEVDDIQELAENGRWFMYKC